MSNAPYTIQDGKMWIDPKFYSYIRMGIKIANNEKHWTENFVLDPSKKTLLCFGGSATITSQEANGNINVFLRMLGLKKQQLENIQTVSHYCEMKPLEIMRPFRHALNRDEIIHNDFVRETLKVFMPFIAKKTKVGWEKIGNDNLLHNMRNILIVTHCAGIEKMIEILNILSTEMLTLGYEQKLIDAVLKQILCISNNSQLEMTETIPTTTIHRYSVTDGQDEAKYDYNYSNSYPAHLSKHSEYIKIKGKKSAFIKLRENETLMAFDKILSFVQTKEFGTEGQSLEHNNAFFETNQKKLTKVGREQIKLIQLIAQYWYNNHDEVPDVMDLLKGVSKGTDLEMFVATSILNGEILKKEHNNPLLNPHSLEVAVNRFKNPDIEPEHTGIWKWLEKKQEHN